MARAGSLRQGTEISGPFAGIPEAPGIKGETTNQDAEKVKKQRMGFDQKIKEQLLKLAVWARMIWIKKIKALLLRCAVWVVNNLFPFWQTYSLKTKVTFGLTDRTGDVGHDKIAGLFGTIREKYGLSHIPKFEEEAGKMFLLKTGGAIIEHYGAFSLGDDIITKINVVDVGGASFKLHGRFISKKTGELCATAVHEIAYTKLNGRPTAINPKFKFLLALAYRQDLGNFSKDLAIDLSEKPEVFRRQLVATSDMINVEQNVSHDVFVALLTGTIELFLLGRLDRPDCAFKVKAGAYKYRRDFYFGDEIIIRLVVVSANDKEVEFGAEFLDQSGNVHTSCTQRIVFTDGNGTLKSVPEKLAAAIKAA